MKYRNYLKCYLSVGNTLSMAMHTIIATIKALYTVYHVLAAVAVAAVAVRPPFCTRTKSFRRFFPYRVSYPFTHTPRHLFCVDPHKKQNHRFNHAFSIWNIFTYWLMFMCSYNTSLCVHMLCSYVHIHIFNVLMYIAYIKLLCAVFVMYIIYINICVYKYNRLQYKFNT